MLNPITFAALFPLTSVGSAVADVTRIEVLGQIGDLELAQLRLVQQGRGVRKRGRIERDGRELDPVAVLARDEIDNSAAVIALQWLALHRDELRKSWR